MAAPQGKLAQIQALRAVAAMAVMCGHSPALGMLGGWGVDLFFVISGFVIAYATETDRRQFIVKRIARIGPLYWLGTLLVFAVALLTPHLVGTVRPNPEWLWKSLLFVPFNMPGALQPRPLLILGWTLNHEMFFYGVFALSLWLSHRYRAAICSALLIGLVIAGQLFPHLGVIARFETNPIILEFIFGFAAFYLWQRFGRAVSGWPSIACLTIAVAVIAILCAVPVTGERVVVWGLPALSVFLLALFGWKSALVPVWLVLTGDASYAIYLVHPYVQNVVARLMGGTEIMQLLVSVAAVVAISIASWIWFERPANRLVRRWFARRTAPFASDAVG